MISHKTIQTVNNETSISFIIDITFEFDFIKRYNKMIWRQLDFSVKEFIGKDIDGESSFMIT